MDRVARVARWAEEGKVDARRGEAATVVLLLVVLVVVLVVGSVATVVVPKDTIVRGEGRWWCLAGERAGERAEGGGETLNVGPRRFRRRAP
jgi:hypothetical protein